MRPLLLAPTLCLLLAPFAGAQPKSDREQARLLGPVKSVEYGRVDYTLKDGRSVEGKRVPVQTTAFGEGGNKTEQVTYDRGGSTLDRLVYTYDAAGRNTGYDEYSSIVDKGLSQPRRHVYTLDGAGRTTEYAVFDSDGSLSSRFTYEYDPEGNKTGEAFHSWNGQRAGRLVYTYDGRGHLLTQTSYDANDTVSWKNVHTYDSQGLKAETAQYQGGKLRYRIHYKYDGKGRVVEEETREFNATPNVYVSHTPQPGRAVYVYDDEKRTKEVATYDGRGSLKGKLVFSFDEKGNDAGVREFNPDGSPKSSAIHWYDRGVLLRTLSGTASVKFEYDSRGNWTRKTYLIKSADSEKPEAYLAEYREITYY